MFQEANLKIFVQRWASVYSPFESFFFFILFLSSSHHDAPHWSFWKLLQFGCNVCRDSICDKPEKQISDTCVCPTFLFSFSNEHSGTLSELYCISFELLLFAVHIVLWKSLICVRVCVCVKMWYNQNESPTRWPFMLDVTRRVWLQNIIWPVSLSQYFYGASKWFCINFVIRGLWLSYFYTQYTYFVLLITFQESLLKPNTSNTNVNKLFLNHTH